eukprot:6490421-Amphidinium_carterae.1
MERVGVTQNDELKSDVEQCMQKARATKASGCLLHNLVNTTNSDELKKKLAAELKEFRIYAGKGQEAKLFHETLWARVQSALKA